MNDGTRFGVLGTFANGDHIFILINCRISLGCLTKNLLKDLCLTTVLNFTAIRRGSVGINLKHTATCLTQGYRIPNHQSIIILMLHSRQTISPRVQNTSTIIVS
jgi:hypothetical protein